MSRNVQRQPVGVAVVGSGWMGRVHSQAYARVLHHFPQLPVRPELVAVADDVPGRAEEAAEKFGFATSTVDWHQLVADPRIQAVSITAPNYLHREMAIAMARGGKNIWVEKPAGLGAGETEAIRDAIRDNGVQGTVGFNYRNAPAVVAAREVIQSGGIGAITHARVQFFSDYAAHPEAALTWRYQRERGGRGVLGDLASHGIDLVRFLMGEIDTVMADTAIFVPERPKPSRSGTGHTRSEQGIMCPVENEDYVACLMRMASGARTVLEACRVSVAEQNSYAVQVHGTKGALFWDFRRMGELGSSVGDQFQDQAVSTVYVGPQDGFYAAFQPGSAIAMSYDDLKVIEAYQFLRSVAEHKPYGATLEDALRCAVVLDALVESAEGGHWVKVHSS